MHDENHPTTPPLVKGGGNAPSSSPLPRGDRGGSPHPPKGRIKAPSLFGSPRLLRALALLSDFQPHRGQEIQAAAQCQTPVRTLVAELRANGARVTATRGPDNIYRYHLGGR